ncbi:chloride channel protein [Streptococcus sp. DD13]|uniref:chloride channel protein n=1 Tax=Streptococcus sp. DD13 TaxID=1777881 RepID=UPI0009EE163B
MGIVIGAIDTLFGQVLLSLSDVRNQHFLLLIPFLALIGMSIQYLYQHWGKDSQKGMSLVFEAASEERKKIPLRLIPLVMLSTWATHLFGGSAGREGVAVQIGATLADQVFHTLRLKKGRHILIVSGIAAGFSGLFQIPLAASFFALEVLQVGRLSLKGLLPVLTASYLASFTSYELGLEKFSHLIALNWKIDFEQFCLLALAGMLFGLIGNLFAYLLKKGKKVLSYYFTNPFVKIFVVGIVLSISLTVLFQGRYSGLGTNLIEASLDGQDILPVDWLLKLLLTVLTLAAGFQGGEVTPLFAIGASAGALLGPLLGIPFPLAIALGYISVFGSATNTLIAPIFIGVEVFGANNVATYVIAAFFAFAISQKHTIYPLQKLSH